MTILIMTAVADEFLSCPCGVVGVAELTTVYTIATLLVLGSIHRALEKKR